MSNYKRISSHIEEVFIDNPHTAPTVKWVNIINAGKREIDYLRKNYKFDLAHLKAAAASVAAQRPLIMRGADYLCLILHFPTLAGNKVIAGEVDIFIGHGYLVTAHYNNLNGLKNLFSVGRKSPDSLLAYSLESSAILLYELLSRLFDDNYQLLDSISLKIPEIEELIFSGQQKKAVAEILVLRRNIISIRKIIQNHKNVLQKIWEMESSIVDKLAIKKYYAGLVEHSKRIWEMLDSQKEMIEVLNSTNESLLNNRMAEIMKTLTLFSVIVIPLTLFAAIFGMNARYMPLVEETYGFWALIIFMIFCSLLMLLYFKRKGWL